MAWSRISHVTLIEGCNPFRSGKEGDQNQLFCYHMLLKYENLQTATTNLLLQGPCKEIYAEVGTHGDLKYPWLSLSGLHSQCNQIL